MAPTDRPAGFRFVPLLVTGEMRTGTTLVTNLLNSQPNCTVYADLLRPLFAEAEALGVEDLSVRLSERQRNVLCSSAGAERWRSGLQGLAEIPRGKAESWFDLYRLLLNALDPAGRSKVVGTKITRQYRYLRQLLDHGVRVVFCIRDPRDVLLSSKNRFGDYRVFEYADRWKRSLVIGRSLSDHRNCELVLFEHLLSAETRPVVLARLSALFDETLTDDLEVLNHRSGISFTSNTSFGDLSTLFDVKAGGRWKEHLDEIEVTFASDFLQREIEELGLEYYKPDKRIVRDLRRAYLRYRATQRVRGFLLSAYRQLFRTPL